MKGACVLSFLDYKINQHRSKRPSVTGYLAILAESGPDQQKIEDWCFKPSKNEEVIKNLPKLADYYNLQYRLERPAELAEEFSKAYDKLRIRRGIFSARLTLEVYDPAEEDEVSSLNDEAIKLKEQFIHEGNGVSEVKPCEEWEARLLRIAEWFEEFKSLSAGEKADSETKERHLDSVRKLATKLAKELEKEPHPPYPNVFGLFHKNKAELIYRSLLGDEIAKSCQKSLTEHAPAILENIMDERGTNQTVPEFLKNLARYSLQRHLLRPPLCQNSCHPITIGF
jgi:hypothetical protein